MKLPTNKWVNKWTLGAVAIVALFAFGAAFGRSCTGWNAEQRVSTVPYIPPVARIVEDAPSVVAEIPVATLQPSPKNRARIGEKHGRSVGRSLTKEEQKLTGTELRNALEKAGEQILADNTVKPSVTPQDVLTTLNPTTGVVTTTVVPDKRHWLGLKGTWEIGGELYRTLPQANNRPFDGRAWVASYPVRLANWNIGGFIGGDSKAKGSVEYGLRFRRP